MEHFVAEFTKQLEEAIQIGKKATLKPCHKNIQNVVITGLGGSGIGGKIVSQLVQDNAKFPIYINNNYNLPGFVNQHTLVLVSSYSGNTEETLSAMKEALEKGAEVACITSGGEINELAQANNLNVINIPGGNPPRTMLAYSLTQQFYLLKHYGLINIDFEKELSESITLLNSEENSIKTLAEKTANSFHNKSVVIYTDALFEGVGIRLRQQLNENSKILCWHHALPEMNHNELVGWAGGNSSIAVLFLRNDSDFERTQLRMELSKEIISKHTKNITDVFSKGNSNIQKALYHIHFGDWISMYLSKLNQVDPVEIKVINHLKSELAKVNA